MGEKLCPFHERKQNSVTAILCRAWGSCLLGDASSDARQLFGEIPKGGRIEPEETPASFQHTVQFNPEKSTKKPKPPEDNL